MKRLLGLALLLTSCAPSLVAGNEAGGVIKIQGMLNGQAKGMATADAHCRQFGKVAKYGGVNEFRGTLRFDCVAP